MPKRLQSGSNLLLSPSNLEWALLLLALLTAAVLRFWRLGEVPPGLYHDEAFNGLDALRVLSGEHALFFPANNGREPLYIYLTSLAVALTGQTAFAVRLPAAVVGTLTTLPMYALGRKWFGWRSGLLAAWIWAITFWPVHLSRIGLRTILVLPALVMTFWLATIAYRRHSNWLWLITGLVYSLGFYTYLAYRFTPFLLLLIGIYLVATGRARWLWPAALWFLAGTLLGILPFLSVIAREPQLFLGRSGQVSILNPDVYEGSVLNTFVRQLLESTGIFFWRGDTILRHNLPGRPLFDPLLAIPFVIGLLWCLRRWRRPPAAVLMLWLVIMLGPTVLAADAPHFLRAAGVLPAAILVAALGLSRLWQWQRLPAGAGAFLAGLLVAASLLWTVRDYRAYAANPELPYAFEAAATVLASEVSDAAVEGPVYIDDRLWTSWPSLEFLVSDQAEVIRYISPADLPDVLEPPVALFAWPYDALDFIPQLLEPPFLVFAADGPQTRGDLEAEPYPLYAVYRFRSVPSNAASTEAVLGDQIELKFATYNLIAQDELVLEVYWEAKDTITGDPVFFAHVTGPDGIAGQVDRPLAAERWPAAWWQPGVIVRNVFVLKMSEPFDAKRHTVTLGLYHADSDERFPVRDAEGNAAGTTWTVQNR
ncbi:MAG: glycosyltransferase family 39 protein [Candidatus Promineifilaceae bacterium]